MKRRAEEPKSSKSWAAVIVGALLLACLLAAGAWWLWPQSSLVPKTASMAKGLLDAGGKPDREAIRQLMTNVDQMPRDELFQLWRSVGEEWRRLVRPPPAMPSLDRQS